MVAINDTVIISKIRVNKFLLGDLFLDTDTSSNPMHIYIPEEKLVAMAVPLVIIYSNIRCTCHVMSTWPHAISCQSGITNNTGAESNCTYILPSAEILQQIKCIPQTPSVEEQRKRDEWEMQRKVG